MLLWDFFLLVSLFYAVFVFTNSIFVPSFFNSCIDYSLLFVARKKTTFDPLSA